METLKAWWQKPWPAIAAALCGAAIVVIVGFWGLGWTRESTAQARVDAAVTAALVPICADKFLGLGEEPNKEYKAANAYNHDDVVRKYIKAVGSINVDSQFARACAAELDKRARTAGVTQPKT